MRLDFSFFRRTSHRLVVLGTIAAITLSCAKSVSIDDAKDASSDTEDGADADTDADTDVDTDTDTDADTDVDTDTDTDTDADVDTDSDADADTDSDPDPACPIYPTDKCEYPLGVVIPFVLTMEVLGLDVRLVDLARGLPSNDQDGVNHRVGLLGLDDSASVSVPAFVVMDVWTATTTPSYARYSVDSSLFDKEPIALVPKQRSGSTLILGYEFVALLCSNDGECILAGASSDTDQSPGLEPIPGSEIKVSKVPRDMAIGKKGLEEPLGLLIAGDGLFVFDGTSWSAEIPPNEEPLFNSVSPPHEGEIRQVAVGDEGRVAVKREDGKWEELSNVGFGVDLLDVDMEKDSFVAVGQDTFVFKEIGQEARICPMAGVALTVVGLYDTGFSSLFFLLGGAGGATSHTDLTQVDGTALCLGYSTNGALISGIDFMLGCGGNWIGLTERSLVGFLVEPILCP